MSTRHFDFAGKSGSVYRYVPLEDDRPLMSVGGNFVIAQVQPEGSTLLFVGETNSLSSHDWEDLLSQARRRYDGAQVLTRLNVRGSIRQAECADLIARHAPPLNGT